MYGRIDETTLTNIADAIRSQYGATTKYYPTQMAQAIRNISVATQSEIDAVNTSIIERTITSLVTNNFHTIGYHAFSECDSLKNVHLTSLTGTIGYEAFANCNVLTTATMSGYFQLDSQVFYNCPKLSRVELTGAILIGNYCFYNCTALDTLILRRRSEDSSNTGLYNENALANTAIANGTGYIYVPEEYLDSYVDKYNQSPWYYYREQFRAIEDYPEICG